MDWLHQLIEAAKGPADAACGASETWDCARKDGLEVDC